MTRRQDLEHKLHTLKEIDNIMAAMKNLALVEIRKLTRLHGMQRRVLETIRQVEADFFAAYPQFLAQPAARQPLLLLIGSERGFCGGFNDALLEQARAQAAGRLPGPATLLGIGGKLVAKLADDPALVERLDGPNVAEEVPSVMGRVLVALQGHLPAETGFAGVDLWAAYHDYEAGVVRLDEISAIDPGAPPPSVSAHPPLLNVAPLAFLAGLIEQHLFASLTGIFYTSLMTENRFRLAHMENATRRIEQKTGDLFLKCNALRQEEITQEIEIILLSTMEEEA